MTQPEWCRFLESCSCSLDPIIFFSARSTPKKKLKTKELKKKYYKNKKNKNILFLHCVAVARRRQSRYSAIPGWPTWCRPDMSTSRSVLFLHPSPSNDFRCARCETSPVVPFAFVWDYSRNPLAWGTHCVVLFLLLRLMALVLGVALLKNFGFIY